MTQSPLEVWIIIGLLGLGTYLIRVSFLGLVGDRQLPEWLLRHLRYTPVAVMPALVAPLVVWPVANAGQPEPVRMVAAVVAVAVGYFTKNVLLAVVTGFGTLLAGLQFLGVS